MLFYVDEFLHIYFNPKEDTDALNIIYRLNESFWPPDRYLVENVEKLQLKYGWVVGYTNCVGYLKIAIENVDNSLVVDKTALNNYGDGRRLYSSRFRPVSDVTE